MPCLFELKWNFHFFPLLLYCHTGNYVHLNAGQMVLNLSVAQICNHTAFNLVHLKSYAKLPLCFVTRMLTDYFILVYEFLIAAEAVNMFVIVVLVFRKIDRVSLKATLIAWSELTCGRILMIICL